MKIFFLPLESTESHYGGQMNGWIIEELDCAGLDWSPIVPEGMSVNQEIERGIYRRCQWAALQVAQVAEAFDRGEVEEGDHFLVGDMWHPGLEAIGYMATLSNLPVHIWAWHYVGCADSVDLCTNPYVREQQAVPHVREKQAFPYVDFIQPIAGWARHVELGWLRLLDGVFVGSEFHARLVRRYHGGYFASLHPIGLVWDYWDVRGMVPDLKPPGDRPKRVIFPHRGAPEKDPAAFYRLAEVLRDRGYDFVITSSREGTPAQLGFEVGKYWRVETGLSKQEYYEILAGSRVVYSAALQETFGYALQEALAFDVTPVCPNRLCYPEVLQGAWEYLYDDPAESVDMVCRFVEHPQPAEAEYSLKYHRSARKALNIMGVL